MGGCSGAGGRKGAPPGDHGGGGARGGARPPPRAGPPRVYGYLLRRCGQREVAEELTSETFLAAADAVRRNPPTDVDVPWLIGIARHKLADHWRRQAREERGLPLIAAEG